MNTLQERKRVQLSFKNTKSKVQQNFKDEVDINNIIARAKKGQNPLFSQKQPMYADLSDLPDYKEALNTVIKAEEAFSALPGKLKKHFEHNPKILVDYMSDPENFDESIELGLRAKPTKQKPVEVVLSGNDPKEPLDVSGDNTAGTAPNADE